MNNFGFDNSQDLTRTEDQYPTYHEYNFDPYYFGFPHRVASPQVTDSFWQQIPISSGNDFIHYSTVYGVYFNHTDSPLQIDAMETTTVKIGYKTNNSSKPKAQQARKRVAPKPELVEIYVGNELVKTIPLRQLIRFSKAAARAFPKPEEKTASSEEGDEAKDSADEKVESSAKAIKDTKKATTLQNLVGSKDKPAKPHNAKNGKVEVASSPKPLPNKVFNVEFANAWQLPTVRAVHQCLTWMDLNKHVHGGQPLGVFYLPEVSEGVSLASYIDVYAAVLALQLRPFPGNLRQRIMDLLTKNKPLAEDLSYIGERVPLLDGVITRVLTSCFNWAKAYEDHEWAELCDYLNVYPELKVRFKEIEASREYNRERQDRSVNGTQRLQRGWQELDPSTSYGRQAGNGNGGGKKRAAKKEKRNGEGNGQGDPTGTAPIKEAQPGELAVGNKEAVASKKEVDGNGKGIGGKHVPGV
ncbi:hypothetical protein LTR56_015492 [Elasticomyces elasticus]|nr:hypothetical protein LTR56_015492 [Elasticomyces elasticus]KAK3662525.1 hypothetical protein LTR22_006591 [Elasticomyces elasticus]KAK4927869.1 hypothetical protein LTR49_005291 [Elasticomyces elasticus]KAK5750216.1 hypothetical protein LTS12_019705 [Elasticomyces elasticus]